MQEKEGEGIEEEEEVWVKSKKELEENEEDIEEKNAEEEKEGVGLDGTQGRGGIDALHANNSCVVCCGGSRCKTCKHLVVGNSFASNVTGKSYNISCPRGSIRCGTKNVIYVISCRKCGVQYVGETSQTLRARFNNHI